MRGQGRPKQRRTLFITGTDTGVGKTVFSAALVRHLVDRGEDVVGLKPFCSGSRDDALHLQQALGAGVPLDRINPWFFEEPLAPAIAAARAGHPVRLRPVLKWLRGAVSGRGWAVVEGAGGLLSPLLADGETVDLVEGLAARPVVVCPNRLGAINQTLLVLRALPARLAREARVVLMRQRRPDSSASLNLEYLQGRLGAERVVEFPRLSPGMMRGERELPRVAVSALAVVLG